MQNSDDIISTVMLLRRVWSKVTYLQYFVLALLLVVTLLMLYWPLALLPKSRRTQWHGVTTIAIYWSSITWVEIAILAVPTWDIVPLMACAFYLFALPITRLNGHEHLLGQGRMHCIERVDPA